MKKVSRKTVRQTTSESIVTAGTFQAGASLNIKELNYPDVTGTVDSLQGKSDSRISVKCTFTSRNGALSEEPTGKPYHFNYVSKFFLNVVAYSERKYRNLKKLLTK